MIEPYYQQDGITIYHGDCRKVLPFLERFDLLLTDIPYGEVNRDSGGIRNLDKGDADNETFDLDWFALAVAGLASSYYVWCCTEQVSKLRAHFVASGMTTRLCIWEKSNPSPMNGEHFWLSSIESCVFARTSGAHFSRHCESPVWRGPIARNQMHPTQKPTWLMQKLITASCPPRGAVLDCCFGSGTTLVAAKREGMTAVGIEINEKYCEIAANRLRQGVLAFGD